MDQAREWNDGLNAEAEDAGIDEAMFDLGGDERRMHVRAYNHWVSLLKGRPYPAIADLDPSSIVDFGAHSVLLDFSAGLDDPGLAFVGRALRDECALPPNVTRIADVPSRSLLSRLTDHYLQIIANRAPIGFEAEFVGARGRTTFYRGILMPFSSDGEAIDYIYGVINWKELADAATQATLAAELDAAVRAAPAANDTPVWADGPHAAIDGAAAAPEPIEAAEPITGSLGDRLALARESAAQVRSTEARGRAALYRTLARAHDFAHAADADPDGYAALLAEAGITVQERAPMTPVVKLVFGADYDKTRLTEYAAVLSHARRDDVEPGALAAWLDGVEGGIKAVVAAERAARRPAAGAAPKRDRWARVRAELAARAPLATVAIEAAGDGFVVLLARANAEGTLDVVARVDAGEAIEAAVRKAA